MKKTHLIGIIIIALGIGAIIATISGSSTYATFSDAAKSPGRDVHIIGVLNKEKPLIYQPEINPGLFAFYLKDRDGTECKVLFNGTRPQDFERSDQIVITGRMHGDDFIAARILMKCPSKYNDGKEEVEVNAVK